jgi:short-subunit dehydrogenase
MTLRQTLLITGSSSGIGREIATLAAARGHTVIASAPTEDLLTDIHDSATMKLVIDICDQSSIDAALAKMDQAGIKLTCLINNAGYAQLGPVELIDETQVRQQFDVNVFGTLAITRAVLPRLREQATADRRCLIVTMSSMLGLVSSPYQGIYAASKHALEGAFSALRMEVRAQNIDISLIEPGWITTHFLKSAVEKAPTQWLNHAIYGKSLRQYFAMTREAESDHPTGAAKMAASMAGTARDVADTVLRALESSNPKAHYPVTAMATWMPRMARIIPARLWDRMQTRQFSP